MKRTGRKERLAWVMWGIMIITYMFNTFHAVAMGVIRPELISEMSLTEGQFVLLTNAFSYAYMVMQIPAGILLDKLGAKKISVIGNTVAAVGIVLFAVGRNYPVLLVGRGMIGLGCSVCFLSVLKICSAWFSERVFCTMSGVTSFVGMVGAMLAQAPLAMLNRMTSWRNIFMVLAAVTITAVLLIVLFVKDSPEKAGLPECVEKKKQTAQISLLKAVGSVVKNRYTWPPLIAYGCFYGTYLLISGVYGSSMVSSFYECSTVQASGCITAAVLGCAVGSVVIGVLSDRWKNRRETQTVCGVLFIGSWILLIFTIGKVAIMAMYPILFLLGFFSCAYAVCWSCVKECNHPDFVGISTSVANMGGYLGSILVPTVIGRVYAQSLHVAGEQHAFGKVMIGAVIINIIGVVAAIFVKETRGENIYGRR